MWRDAKVGAVSAIGWDARGQEAFCSASSYVGGIEHADLFFKRVTVEMNRRAANLKKLQVVFLADGATWIWERFAEMAPEGSISLQELHDIRDGCERGELWDFVDGQMKYFTDNENRMGYDLYRAARLPIGSGTIESACKNVIGGRMKQGGMTWSEAGANGILQIRSSIASGRHLQDFIATLDLRV